MVWILPLGTCKWGAMEVPLFTLFEAVDNGTLDGVDPVLPLVGRAAHELVHLGLLLALADQVDALRVLRVALLAHQQLRQRYHTRLQKIEHTILSKGVKLMKIKYKGGNLDIVLYILGCNRKKQFN